MEAPLEARPVWSQILPLLADEPIPVVAARFKLSPGEIAVAIKRSGLNRKAVVREGSVPEATDVDSLPPEPQAASVRKPSRIEAFRHLVGVEPDGVVARKAGVGRKAVREYRARHGIARAERPATPAGEPRRSGLKSPLDAFAHLFGTLPDSEIARRAGVTRGALYQYRTRRGIPAFQGPKAPEREPTASAPDVVVAPVATVERPPVEVRSAWTVQVRRPAGDEAYIVLGTDIHDACGRAIAAVRDGRVISVSLHLPAL